MNVEDIDIEDDMSDIDKEVEDKIKDMKGMDRENELLFTIFELEGEDYGASVDVMDEIVKDVDPFNIPGAPDYVLGAANLRGNVVPIIDLKKILGIGKTEKGWKEVLLINHQEERYAMPVDKLKDMISPKKEQLIDPTSITNLRDKMLKWIISLEDNQSIRVIDMGELISGKIEDLEIEDEG